ncbi:hypothetical protein AVEN_118013-1 [Araneus ventricosus]|uniref:Uncharacterized protein n=1 Tax=Araneus ventricosus TaxID=182803 RepID=A0A4Y2C8A5_ARAVE|nr:hypothetical protein AVEN_118013-1 [Araneus ventricosus]
MLTRTIRELFSPVGTPILAYVWKLSDGNGRLFINSLIFFAFPLVVIRVYETLSALDIASSPYSKPFISLPKWKFGTRLGKNNRQGRKPMENSIAAGKTWISIQTKFQAFFADYLGGTLMRW